MTSYNVTLSLEQLVTVMSLTNGAKLSLVARLMLEHLSLQEQDTLLKRVKDLDALLDSLDSAKTNTQENPIES